MSNDAITNFHGEFDYLSNFYPSPIEYDGTTWPTVEHAFQAAKTDDGPTKHHIHQAATPGQAKRLGRTVPLCKDWDIIKYNVMRELVAIKFQPGTALAAKLTATGKRELIEGNNWHDTTWGKCMRDGGWVGLNWLGEILMRQREALRDE